jgi:MFS family permease
LDFYSSIITTVFNLGAMTGAIIGGVFGSKFGKWNMIMACNVVCTFGYVFCVYAHIWAVMIGRFLTGLGIGGFSVFVPKFINEITPFEYKGPMGTVLIIGCTTGILLPSVFALFYDYDTILHPHYLYCRLMWGFPILVSTT